MENQERIDKGNDTSLTRLKEDVIVWTSDVDFWLDKMEAFQSELDNSIRQSRSIEELKKIDHLQNIVTYYSKELLIVLKSKVFHHHEAIDSFASKKKAPNPELIEIHDSMHQKMDDTEKILRGYSREFTELELMARSLDEQLLGSLKKILIPTDFSANAQRATDYILSILGSNIEEIILLKVFHSPFASNGRPSIIEEEVAPSDLESFQVENRRLRLAFPSFQAKLTIRHDIGHLPPKIAEVAKEEGVDLIVMGTKGRTGLSGVLFGSNARHVIQQVELPVLLVPFEAPLLPPKNIMLALDLRLETRPQRFDILTSIRDHFRSRLDVIHIEAPDAPLVSVHDKVHEENILRTLALNNAHIQRIKSTKIKETINQQVAERSIDLLCIIENEHGWLYRAMGKSVTSQMVIDTHIPLLILRQ